MLNLVVAVLYRMVTTSMMQHIVAMKVAVSEVSEKKVQRNVTKFVHRRVKVI
jgi:hypothetical protein